MAGEGHLTLQVAGVTLQHNQLLDVFSPLDGVGLLHQVEVVPQSICSQSTKVDVIRISKEFLKGDI